ncbi:MAG TPA: SurA N-terminal domain-containing protein [Paracoccaceae bacterium]|nr:SurA N-terminal domain-containing protein [Paracoccaceae bacterium]
MLRQMRIKGANILVWAILGLLIAGLAGFGISDMLRGGLTNTVASVGDEDISAQDFARAFQRELRRLGEMQGRQVTVADARAMGLDGLVLNRLIRIAAVDAEARRVGLSVSDATVEREIAQIKEFQGPDGRFSVEQARLVLQNALITEAELRDDVRMQLTRDILLASLTSGASLPPAYLEAILTWRGERRAFAWVRLDAERFGGDPAQPSEEELAAYHKAHEADYTIPETRAVAYALLDPAELAKTIEIPQDDILATYKSRIDRYRTPERRSLERLAFATQAEAEEARRAIEAGETTLRALAEARGLAPSDIEMGDVAASSLPASARDAVFALAEPGLAGPVATDLGPTLYQVNAILAASETPLEAAEEEIRAELARSRAREEALKLLPKVEDLVAGGARVEEIAQEAGLTLAKAEVPATGPASGMAADAKFREAALAAKTGTETDLTETADGRYFVLRVDEIRPAALQPLEQVREAVLAAWLNEKKREAAAKKAEALAAEIRAGAAFQRAALAHGLTPAAAAPITRDATPPGLPASLVAAIFAAEPNGTVTARDDSGTYVAQLQSILSYDPAAPENAELARLYQQTLDRDFSSDLFQYYTIAVELRDGPEINPSVLDSVLSRAR